ncbi:hypothetical protein KIN20_035283 [Parelaphostrongylus tenuis]|uniref:Uncharacterized protein n=1 Tax=Parelaphostrongylus tenuis TaxID=148309 RepID=A0AAD5WJT7_PARTN|nr:hypothetical protein KIN20_035283 [Parelaphostrongylus tenuis]
MAKHPTELFIISVLATISTAFGCGVMPAGQASTRNFTVTGFTLPVAMAYAGTSEVSVQVPGIATSASGARGFVERLVMQTVFHVLERQARSALIPDAIITTILDQLQVRVTYVPLSCHKVINDPTKDNANDMDTKCIVVDTTVTGICAKAMGKMGMCMANGRENNGCS